MQVLTAAAGFGHSDCERVLVGALAQPILAVTSLAYVAAGLAVLSWAVRAAQGAAGWGRGVALVAVGVGSFAYHGPQPSWAKLAHDWPIVATGAVYAIGLARSGRRQRWSAWAKPAGSSRWGWPPTPRDAPARRCAAPTACGSTARRLARPVCRCRRMGRPGHGAGPAGEPVAISY